MMLQFSVRRSADTVILQCAGRIVAGEPLMALQQAATAQRGAELVIDLHEVEALDAAGLGSLLRIRHWCDSQGITLKLANPNKHVREVLCVTALDSVLDVHSVDGNSESKALLREWACAET